MSSSPTSTKKKMPIIENYHDAAVLLSAVIATGAGITMVDTAMDYFFPKNPIIPTIKSDAPQRSISIPTKLQTAALKQ